MRMIRIEKCDDCPHFDNLDSIAGPYPACTKSKNRDLTDEYKLGHIPDWCPLEKIKR